MPALLLFLAGVIIGTVVEPFSPKVKTLIWVFLVVLGIIGGALQYLKVV